MKRITIEELQKDVAGLISGIEKGEAFVIVREGKAIAEVSPVVQPSAEVPSCKLPGPRLKLEGVELSKIIIEERHGEDVL